MEKQKPTVEDLEAKVAELEESLAIGQIVSVRFQQLYANEVAASANLGARLQRHLERQTNAASVEQSTP